jgi:hypothetical protein
MTLNYYDYSEPSNRMAVFRDIEKLKGIAMKDVSVAYFLTNLANNVNFIEDCSKGFYENERLKRLEEIKNEEITQNEINLFLKNKRLTN